MGKEVKKNKEQIVENKPVTHVAISIENLQGLFDYLRTLEGISFAEGNEILDIVRKDSMNLSMTGNPDDVLNPPPGDKVE